jgi:hypothetical protein
MVTIKRFGILALGLERFDAACFAFCLMGNHYHLVVQTRNGHLSRFVRHERRRKR